MMKDITDEFIGLEKGALCYSPMFEKTKGTPYNCVFDKVVEGQKIVVTHNGIKYIFDADGGFGTANGRQIFLKKGRRRF